MGKPAVKLSLDEPDQEPQPVLSNQLHLATSQVKELIELLKDHEEILQTLKDKEEVERTQTFHRIIEFLIERSERDKHTIYNPDLSWDENRRVVLERYEAGAMPATLTKIERRILSEALEIKHHLYEQEKAELKRQNDRVRLNLARHHLFWQRLRGLWLNLTPDERMHILRQLLDSEWDDDTVAEIKRVVENAQWFASLGKQAGSKPKHHKMTGEEGKSFIDLDHDLWRKILDLYKDSPETN